MNSIRKQGDGSPGISLFIRISGYLKLFITAVLSSGEAKNFLIKEYKTHTGGIGQGYDGERYKILGKDASLLRNRSYPVADLRDAKKSQALWGLPDLVRDNDCYASA